MRSERGGRGSRQVIGEIRTLPGNSAETHDTGLRKWKEC
jgi:hypothetical protein